MGAITENEYEYLEDEQYVGEIFGIKDDFGYQAEDESYD